MNQTPGLIIAAPSSGAGKTTVTLGILRALRRAGVAVASCKAGPDYIDPAFHAAAAGRACRNLDPWAMRPDMVLGLAARAGTGADLVVAEGVMGLFDGAHDGSGSTADLAALLGWPVVLVIDVKGQAQSAAAVLHGFMGYRADIDVSGVIFNRVGGPRHVETLVRAVEPMGVAVLGCLPWRDDLVLPDRHLGLVQATENPELENFLDRAAGWAAEHLDLAALRALAREGARRGEGASPLPPLGGRIALAQDQAFAFAYPHLIEGWRAAGAEIVPFSPLADQAPDERADAVYLPGGYPELHAGRLAANRTFLDGLRAAAARGANVFGECGGYMVLGQGLIDADGERHAMAGLLALETSFAARRLHLGYRSAVTTADGPFGPKGTTLRGHEFHYAAILAEDTTDAPFLCRDSSGRDMGPMGGRRGSVTGSFLHLIDLV